MAGFFAKLNGVDVLKGNLKPGKLLFPAMKRFLQDGGETLVSHFRTKVEDQDMVYTGEFRDSFSYSLHGSGMGMWDDLEFDQKKAIWLEYGTAPFFPNVENITPWAEDHDVEPWALAIQFATFGIKPRPFMDDALRESIPDLLGLVSQMAHMIESSPS